MASLNECNFIGHIGKDPEIKSLQSGAKVANFSIACSEKWRDKSSGETKEHTEWVNIVVWQEGLVKVVEQYLKKGSKVYISGQMKTRKWQDQSGNDRWSTEVVLQGFGGKLIMLDGKDNSGGSSGGQSDNSGQSSASSHQSSQRPQAYREPSAVDDDIPF